MEDLPSSHPRSPMNQAGLSEHVAAQKGAGVSKQSSTLLALLQTAEEAAKTNRRRRGSLRKGTPKLSAVT